MLMYGRRMLRFVRPLHQAAPRPTTDDYEASRAALSRWTVSGRAGSRTSRGGSI